MLKLPAGVGNSKDNVANFRVFKIDEEGHSTYSSPLQKKGNGPQPIVYVLVSIMNNLFNYGPSVEHMMIETEKAYSNPTLPIIYVCADSLQNITKKYLFGDMEQDPIEKYRKKWKEKYDDALARIQTADMSEPKHEILYWDTLKNSPDYKEIKKFTAAILTPELTLESLQEKLFNAPEKVLENLLQDVHASKILTNIPVIAEGFISKNLTKLKKLAKTREAERLQYEEKGVMTKSLTSAESNLNEIKIGLTNATYDYTAEDFAVLLLLGYSKDAQKIRENFLPSLSIEVESKLQPIISYPVSTTVGGEKTSETYYAVEALYRKYCTLLSLPIISQPLTIIDSLVPDQYNPHHIKNQIYSEISGNKDKSMEDKKIHAKMTQAPPNSEKRKNSVTISPPLARCSPKKIEKEKPRCKSAEPRLQSRKSSFSSQNNMSFFVAAKQTKLSSPDSRSPETLQSDNHYAEKIAKKIITIMDGHLKTGAMTREISIKNFTYKIQVLEKSSVSESKIVSLEDMKDLIKDAVMSAEEGYDEKINLHYKNYSFSLEVGTSHAYALDKRSKTPSPTAKTN